MTYSDPAMVGSNFERIEKDRYWTEHWCTRALLRHVDLRKDLVWEPACGAGDIVKVLQEAKINVVASDIELSDFDIFSCGCSRYDFFTEAKEALEYFMFAEERVVTAIVTNPPYGDDAERFLRHALSLDVDLVAMFMRSEFNQAKGRLDLFRDEPRYAFEIALTSRPQWDWWLTPDQKRARRVAAGRQPDQPDATPRHNFSWFVWDRTTIDFTPTTYWEGREKNEAKKK